jgi:hypothetical protein
MTIGNDGGWCGISAAQGSAPFQAGLVQTRPDHGRLNIRRVGDVTRIDYFPDPGFVGPDAFAVRLLPGNAEVRATVTVQPGPASARPASAAPAATAPAAAPRASTPAPAARRR